MSMFGAGAMAARASCPCHAHGFRLRRSLRGWHSAACDGQSLACVSCGVGCGAHARVTFVRASMWAPRRRDCLTGRGEPGGAFAEQNEGPAILAEFRAGRLLKEGNTMKPDLTKGRLQTCHADDGLIHFQWVERETNVVHEDLIVFPGDAKLVPMAQKRCWMLEFAQGTPHFRRRRVSVPTRALASPQDANATRSFRSDVPTHPVRIPGSLYPRVRGGG